MAQVTAAQAPSGRFRACTTVWSLAALFLLSALTFTGAASASPPEGTWWPDGVVCVVGMTPICRYVAPGCELVRVMDTDPNLAGTRYVLVCRAPRGAA